MKTEIELLEEIKHHDNLYWKKSEPEINDIAYDSLVENLRKLYPNNEYFTKVQNPKVESTNKVEHTSPMLSLDKKYSYSEIVLWMKLVARTTGEKFKIQPKYDGISAEYIDGTQLSTRGGEDISNRLMLPMQMLGNFHSSQVEFRGELILSKRLFETNFHNIKSKSGTPYKNPRNAISGLIMRDDVETVGAMLADNDCYVTFMEHDNDHNTRYTDLKDLNEELFNYYIDHFNKLDFPLDGLVIKLADKEYSESLGNTSHHPRGQMAFKFTNESKKSKMIGVRFGLGKSKLTPVALIEPVDIGGVTITQATLHNMQMVEDKDIQIGDTLIIERAGDVIPYVADSIKGTNRQKIELSECPSCSSKLSMDGVNLRCTNPECPAVKMLLLQASVNAFGIEYLKGSTLQKIIDYLNVQDAIDLLAVSVDDLLTIPSIEIKSATSLYNEIQKINNTTDYKVLASLNISGVGVNFAQTLMKNCAFKELRNKSINELMKIPKVGNIMAGYIHDTLIEKKEYIDSLINVISNIEQTFGSLDSKTICFTGAMSKPRSHYEKLARANGLRPISAVNKDLSILAVADVNTTSSKAVKARKYGIELVNVDEWVKSLGVGEVEENILEISNMESAIDNSLLDEIMDIL